MKAILDAVNGKKTYILAGLGALVIIAANAFHTSVLGVDPAPDWPTQLWQVLLVAAGRSAVSK